MEGKKGSCVRGILFAGIAVGTVLLAAAIVIFTPLNRIVKSLRKKHYAEIDSDENED